MLLVVWETGEWRRWFGLLPQAQPAVFRRGLARAGARYPAGSTGPRCAVSRAWRAVAWRAVAWRAVAWRAVACAPPSAP
jgi:hypothetical protein